LTQVNRQTKPRGLEHCGRLNGGPQRVDTASGTDKRWEGKMAKAAAMPADFKTVS
jgi:hypothetical protein